MIKKKCFIMFTNMKQVYFDDFEWNKFSLLQLNVMMMYGPYKKCMVKMTFCLFKGYEHKYLRFGGSAQVFISLEQTKSHFWQYFYAFYMKTYMKTWLHTVICSFYAIYNGICTLGINNWWFVAQKWSQGQIWHISKHNLKCFLSTQILHTCKQTWWH